VINLRYHIVSIVAVFLALGIGVLMGSTVVDRATVDFLRNRIDDLEAARDDARERSGALDADLRRLRDLDQQFQVEGRDQLVQGRLSGVPIVVVGVRGIREEPVDELEELLASSGAVTQGTVWLTERLTLDDDGERDALVQALAVVPPADDADFGALAVDSLAAALAPAPPPPGQPAPPAPPSPPTLPALRDAGFVDYDAPPEGSPYTGGLEGLVLPATRVVVVSGTGAHVPHDALALALVRRIGRDRPGALLAAEVVGEAADGEETPRFVPGVRGDEEARAAASTVDNLETFYGQLAVVLGLADLAQGRPVGHYGVGEGAQRLLPPPPAPPA
jgi:hypothetical protein